MILLRYGENRGAIPGRTRDRFYQAGKDWFFAIRRGIDQGPYRTRGEAQQALRQFIEGELRFESCLLNDRVSVSG